MQSTITFLLGETITSLSFDGHSRYTPTTTVLQYLRSLPGYRGTKEGCAEGDCGACTVVVAGRSANGSIKYKAIDSCLVFLPMLHGKQLITVEHLKQTGGTLHPVQQAMVDLHGSQCGYCTPGIVMSLFSLYKNHPHAAAPEIEDALTGNLCRCTGYKPIIQAAATACAQEGIDQFTAAEPRISRLLEEISNVSIHLQTAQQEYFKPASLGEAITLKHKYPDALIVSGATDIALRVTKKHEVLPLIIDISDLAELKEWFEQEESLTIGAGVSLNDVAKLVTSSHPAFASMLGVFGSHQVRNLATLGGSLGTASPIGDPLPVLIAYQASIVLEGINGRRVVPLDGYVTGYRKTVLKPDELITSVILPKHQPGAIVHSYKVSKRRDLDISTVSAGFRLELEASSKIQSVILAYGGMAERTKRAAGAEQFLSGKIWNRQTVEEAMTYIDTDFTPISDARSGADFRKAAARNLLLKFWSENKSMLESN